MEKKAEREGEGSIGGKIKAKNIRKMESEKEKKN